MTSARRAGWTAERPEQHYLVEPRYLAGGGDLRYVTEALRASGWRTTTLQEHATILLSPDRAVRIGFAPDGWAVAGVTDGGDAWHAELSPRTPVEIIAGFTDALTRPPAAHAPNVWAPLREHGWQEEQGQHVSAVSAARDAWVQYHQPGPGRAQWWIGAAAEHGTMWSARFTATTPLYLLEAFTGALADPEPVLRPRAHVPTSNRLRTTSVSVLPAQYTAWLQARVSTARSATWARNAPTARRHTNRLLTAHRNAPSTPAPRR
ncbi:DUF317 domain-containing protein [Streptomyces sp. MS19]|uniref:DUF317 domain-containing protein n=1 Tax=Streptomyces sp. MS19 TaxID=3385972 RepID=UPI0039A20C5B